jgi:hypothetical protein
MTSDLLYGDGQERVKKKEKKRKFSQKLGGLFSKNVIFRNQSQNLRDLVRNYLISAFLRKS